VEKHIVKPSMPLGLKMHEFGGKEGFEKGRTKMGMTNGFYKNRKKFGEK